MRAASTLSDFCIFERSGGGVYKIDSSKASRPEISQACRMFKIHLLGSELNPYIDKQTITRTFFSLFYQRGRARNLLPSKTVQLKNAYRIQMAVTRLSFSSSHRQAFSAGMYRAQDVGMRTRERRGETKGARSIQLRCRARARLARPRGPPSIRFLWATSASSGHVP
jgi:hypothetical protein